MTMIYPPKGFGIGFGAGFGTKAKDRFMSDTRSIDGFIKEDENAEYYCEVQQNDEETFCDNRNHEPPPMKSWNDATANLNEQLLSNIGSHSQVAHPPIGFGSGFGAGFKTKFGDRSTPQPHIRSNDEVIAQTRKYGNGFKKEYSTSSPQPQPQPQQEQEQTSAKVKDRFTPYTRSIGELIKEDEESAEYYSKVHQNDVEVVCVSGNHDSYLPMKSWNDANANLDRQLLANIHQARYREPRQIQQHVIPLALKGYDIKAQSETGSGKTAAFLIPIIQAIFDKNRTGLADVKPKPYALIIVPTRELCLQVHEQARKLSAKMDIKVCKSFGGISMQYNLCEVNQGCEILCICPGRLRHYVNNTIIELDKLEFLILDEVDRLLSDRSYSDDIWEAVKNENFPKQEQRQTMLFSATFPKEVQIFSDTILKQDSIFVSNQKYESANSRVIQKFIQVADYHEKNNKLQELLQETKNHDGSYAQTLVFVEKKRDSDKTALYLCSKGIRSQSINGDRPQRLRDDTLRDFRNKRFNVLVATDVCARGLDIKNLDHVINFDLPNEHKRESKELEEKPHIVYVHRIGRTGRINVGQATSFYLPHRDKELAPKLVEILRETGNEVPDFLLNDVPNDPIF